MICSSCRSDIPESTRICPKCGARIAAAIPPLEVSKLCPQCGAENPASALVCKVDGFEFKPADEPPNVYSSPPATRKRD
jgi:predicted amidophosphoribosyltransferase